jgi:hypothetical protein
LFGYLGDGDIVPCVAVFRGGSQHEGSVFEHTISVDEVAITFGARGAFLRELHCKAGTNMTHERRRMFYTFKEAANAGAYDESPMLPEGVDHRTCGACRTVHPEIDLAGYRWAQIAEELSSPQ